MRFWRHGRAAIVLLAACALGSVANPQKPAAQAQRTNELTLAGLRPGKDALETAEKRYPNKTRHPSPMDMLVWVDCALLGR